MKDELDRSKASYKLDLIEAANADPVLTQPDFKLLAAYVAVMAWPSCKTWLAASLGMAMTGLSHGQFWKSRSRLIGENPEQRAYLVAVRGSKEKVSEFHLINPWRDEAKDRVKAMLGHHREVDRQKKARKKAASSLHSMEGQTDAGPSTPWSSIPPNCGGNTPLVNPPREEGAGEKIEGSNVLPFNKRRAS
ncbi:MAG: hypothetical protein EOR51_12155 [Mesorhizobium sp.]|uniref:hypothetical protein n=1 Tax=Mesorhizobium sp. TaxID=1871066 RepID=UPI000FE8BEA9|nr:hypothetical protein [Mesorhizobium sp.]RWK79654.1 MAG: hypothetical protein EOR50_05885 [Mesorhizobium sp.]RWK82430.1 MAG: hypothetical protein EOR51_12155 [Mesorhizobium sp.]RWL08751.1 MAG: hypothetical protein EOR55_03395 [Mesorhizobium sp.]